MKKIGIIGGGQLGRMMAMESHDLDVSIAVLDPTPDCPASKYAAQVVGDFSDYDSVLEFGADKDVLTFEIESANADALLELEKQGVVVHPSPATLKIIKDKYEQKDFLSKHGIPVAPYTVVNTAEEVRSFASEYNYPLVLKSRFGAYDGRGNRTIKNEHGIETAMSELGNKLYVEAWVPFTKELAVVAARDQVGTTYTYPVVETIHTDHICDVVVAPAEVPDTVAQKAETLATRILEIFDGAGVFGIEMFLTKMGEVIINEIAPRVHNSGHFTLSGCNVSQFKQHILAICGGTLIKPEIKGEVVVMKNILGDRNAPADPQGIEEAEATGAYVEIYGKKDTKVRRKMGHLTVVADSRKEALSLVNRIMSLISI